MQSNYPYLKALIIFPLIMQILGTIIAVCISDNTDEMFGVVDLVLFHMYVTFFVATIPAFLIALWAKAYRYIRYNVFAIVLISAIIAFCYSNVAGFVYMTLFEKTMTFGIWLRSGALDVALLFSCGMALYSVLTLPLLLPKER
ncbi:hypothetical protein [Aggregatibacter kilianii]|jgi:hypothetical protein|uniref:hypothetical protein n=1 Tax=Aggregatibacter kilianii TaxID=2025884 RepID=UPI000D649DB8|nr:hypothetical protein [Aggregatibacter kilianii]RDE85953.1 hypothetical protein DPV90_08405 [Aggregatibacter aphrophilus]RDE99975.1 hypothetical protein DPV99_10295 [Aggregatibacter aphrophilus]